MRFLFPRWKRIRGIDQRFKKEKSVGKIEVSCTLFHFFAAVHCWAQLLGNPTVTFIGKLKRISLYLALSAIRNEITGFVFIPVSTATKGKRFGEESKGNVCSNRKLKSWKRTRDGNRETEVRRATFTRRWNWIRRC